MGGYAWVTLATNDSYSLGALVLAHSLKQAGTQQQLAVLVTPGVTNPMREKLAQVFNVVQEVNILDSKDEANLRLLKRPELGITFTKLHCWRLTQFDKCVFLDADTLVLENCDELFEREELSAAPDVGWPDCFNTGVFVYRPSNETYEKLIQFALEKGSFDGGDQGLLNLYFSDWAHKDISKHLPFIYNMCSTACYSYLPAYKQFGGNAKIIHFIGATKPWLQYFDTESKTVHPSEEARHIQDVLQRWWNIFCSLIHPSLTPDMSGLAGAFAQLTLGTPRTAEQAALDDHLRRQGWEVGNIDYLGRDSFENIWSKICETLSSGPEQPAPKPKAPSPPVTSEVSPPEEPTAEVISEQKSSPELEKPQEPEAKSEPINEEVVESESAKSKTSSEVNLPQDSAAPEIKESPQPPPESITPQPVPDSPKLDETSVKSEIAQPVEEGSPSKLEVTQLEETLKPAEPLTATAPVQTIESSIPAAEGPKPAPAAVSSSLEPVPESPKPAPDVVPESPKPVPDTVPDSSKPAPVLLPETPKSVQDPVPESPKPALEAIQIPTPEVDPESQKPAAEVVPESPTATPVPVLESPKPLPDPVPESPEPVPDPAPESPKLVPDPVSESHKSPAEAIPEIPTPTAAIPVVPTPESSQPTPEPIPLSPVSAPKKEKTVPKPLSEVAAKTPKPAPQSPKSAPESPKPLPESPKSESAPPVSSVIPKSPVSVSEKKPSAKKSSSKEAPQLPKAEVTEATPPTSPVSPQPKQSKQPALVVDTSVPDTPPPASSEASAATPTPPPRKASGAPKKPSTKTKK